MTDGVWQRCMWKMVCNQDVCERWCVTKLCVCDKDVCERWCVCVWQSCVCVLVSARPATQNESGCHQVQRLPCKTNVNVAKCHACHVKRRQTSPSATPATQRAAASQRDQARHQSQPSPISTTPATLNQGGCRQAPRLPRKEPRRHSRTKSVARASPVP